MQIQEKYYDEIFDFKGQWDIPSKCGLKILNNNERTIIIVTELYLDNPGTSVTYAGKKLMTQICEAKNIAQNNVTYIECNPNMNSKLDFYDEEFFEVQFGDTNTYRRLAKEELKDILPQ